MSKLTKAQEELSKKCTPLQRDTAFNLFKNGGSRHQAYMDAGGNGKDRAAQDVAASRIMKLPHVQDFYDSLIEKATSKAVMTKQQALERLSRSASVSIVDVCEFVEEDGKYIWKVKDFNTVSPEIACCVKSVTITSKGPKLELYDSHGAIKQLSEMLGWNAPRKAELTGKDGQAIMLKSDIEAPEIAAALSGLMDKL